MKISRGCHTKKTLMKAFPYIFSRTSAARIPAIAIFCLRLILSWKNRMPAALIITIAPTL
jgi:hypothetical protein